MKGDAVFICARYLFESMDCGLAVLWVGRTALRGKKCECRGNVRASESCQKIDAANNNLIGLYLTWKISIKGVNGRNGVNGEPGTMWSHVGNLVISANQ